MLSCAQCQSDLASGVRECPECNHPVSGAALAIARGIDYFNDLRYDPALKEFERARQIAPHDLDVRRCYAHGLYHTGRIESALSHYRTLAERQPDNVEVRYNLGQILINQGRLEQARNLFEELAELNVDIEPDRFYLGLLFSQPTQFRADCYYYLAIACWNRAETEAAEHYYQRALELNPAHTAAFRHLGNLHFQAKDYSKAIELYENYLDLYGEDGRRLDHRVDVCCNLGIAHFEQGDADRATALFKQVLKDQPGHAGAIYHMNLIYKKQGIYTKDDMGAIPIHEESEGASMLFGLSRRGGGREDAEGNARTEDPRPIIGKSVAMQRVLRFARLAAASDSTVLITGENGTGKELIARAIYNNSPRRDRIFLPINCAAIPEALIESELFGHEMGAFTGAVARKAGFLETADGGTVFLDEFGELDLNMQVKLLRFLQEREFNLVGGAETISVDLRIIAATNQDLEERIAEGRFRQDLFYRLNVLPIHVPPLRERHEDIPLLVDHFVYKYGKGSVRRESLIDPDDMHILMEYDWPGNIRELENVIERALVMGAQVGSILQGIADSRRQKERKRALEVSEQIASHQPGPGPITRREPNGPPVEAMAGGDEAPGEWRPGSIREIEKRHILRTLRHTRGNRTEASRLLGINPATLWRKVKIYEIGD